jgi:hypothetical protein
VNVNSSVAEGRPKRLSARSSRQTGGFGLRVLQDRNARIGALPSPEKILVSGFGPGIISGDPERSRQLQARHHMHRIEGAHPGVIDDLPEFCGGFPALMRHQVRKAAQVDGGEGSL